MSEWTIVFKDGHEECVTAMMFTDACIIAVHQRLMRKGSSLMFSERRVDNTKCSEARKKRKIEESMGMDWQVEMARVAVLFGSRNKTVPDIPNPSPPPPQKEKRVVCKCYDDGTYVGRRGCANYSQEEMRERVTLWATEIREARRTCTLVVRYKDGNIERIDES